MEHIFHQRRGFRRTDAKLQESGVRSELSVLPVDCDRDHNAITVSHSDRPPAPKPDDPDDVFFFMLFMLKVLSLSLSLSP